MFSRLWRQSIWHPDAVPPEEWKYRWLKRIWLPAYDLLAIAAGIWAAVAGSPLLYTMFGSGGTVDALGIAFAIAATVCLAGVAFPALYKVEILGKVLLVGMLGAYAAAITLSDSDAWFVSYVVLMTLPLPLYRLNLLGEEIKERRNQE